MKLAASAILIFAFGSMTMASSEETVIKSLNCEGERVSVAVEVTGSAVKWIVKGSSPENFDEYMVYIFSDTGSLESFNSSDLGSDLSVSGSTATLSIGDEDHALTCVDTTKTPIPEVKAE